MTLIGVFIATTAGPVQVMRIAPDSAENSLVFLKRSTTTLSMSDDYDDFVSRRSGVILREFGDADTQAYLIELSGRIDSGDSWQLGVFVAHAVTARENVSLAGYDETPDQVLWLTGEVNRSLGIESVSHIAEKLKASQNAFSGWQSAGIPVTIVMEAAEDADAASEYGLPDGADFIAANSTDEVLGTLGLLAKRKPDDLPESKEEPPVEPKRRKKTPLLTAAGVFALVGGGMVVWQQGWIGPLATLFIPNVVQAEMPELMIYERRAPSGATCPSVHFSRARAVEVAVSLETADTARSSSLDGVCGLAFVVSTKAKDVLADLSISVKNGRYVRAGPRPPMLAAAAPLKERSSWHIDLPMTMREPLEYTVIARFSSSAKPDASSVRKISHRVVP